MAELVHVGSADLPHGVNWERYFEKLSFIETSILVKNPAKPSVLARWRASAPGPGAFSVLAPAITATGITRGPAPLVEALRTLEANAVVFQTPPGFSPSSANRDQLRRFFSETFPAELSPATRVWQPSGLWEVRPAVTLARELGVVLGWDPLLRDPTQDPPDLFATLEVPEIYFRVEGLGRGSRTLSASQQDELAGLVESYERLWMVFATVGSMADATRFQRTIGLTADGAG
jgi:uncharacterized protein YecE (DUF72 family)